MAGDYTRMTFEPRKDHAGVLMQQGRVTLDADWNELVELIDRRLRAETIDVIGRCVVPKETPDGFAIGLAGGTLTIGRGRAYVDGLLAENHGAGPLEFDPVLAELRGTQPVAYEQQPYLPNAAAAAPLPTSGTHLAYLDVWQREVTHLEDPELVEKAIGVDTATRLQTAWQVRLLEAPTGTTCDARVPGWDALTAPSAGRLTTGAVGVPVATDPCTIPPSGGYRGTENRLYRVEIHDEGPLGTATFKWSRDNASIASRVTAIDASRKELTLVRLGRDSVQRIRVDDWVEVTDDWLELDGRPGELRKVVAVDEVEEKLTLATALSAGTFDATDAARHTRVRRWDQSGPAVDAAGGVVGVPAAAGTAIVLEDGVEIRFDVDPAGGSFRVGDHWAFATRTADASVEVLVAEPPRGIHHHFCRLAVVTFPRSVTDCRTLWPPDVADGGDHGCDCTVCVTPESHASGELTIQRAIDLVTATGGKVCLQVGFYRLDRAVRITGAQSVELRGRGWRTILITAGREPAIVVERSLGVTVGDLTVLTTTPARKGAAPMGIAIGLRNTIGTLIERCVLLQLGLVRAPEREAPGVDDAAATDELGDVSRAFAAAGPRAAGAPLIALDGLLLETRIRENVLVGTNGIGPVWADLHSPDAVRTAMDAAARSAATAEAARGYVLTFDLVIEDNLFLCWLTGVALEGFCLHLGETRIAGNSLLGCQRAGIVSTGFQGPGGAIEVVRNLVRVLGHGLVVGADDTRVADNTVGPLDPLGRRERSRGAGIVLAPSLRPSGIDRCLVHDNRVVGVGGVGIELRTEIVSADISRNVVQGANGGIMTTDELSSAKLLTIAGNQLLDIWPGDAGRGDLVVGVLAWRAVNAAVVGNTVIGVGRNAALARYRLGVAVVACERARVSDNDVVGVGPADDFVGISAGVLVKRFRSAEVIDNVARRVDDEARREGGGSRWFGILVGRLVQRDVDDPIRTAVHEADGDDGRLWVSARGRFIRRFERGDDTVAVRGNLVDAYGGVPAVLVQARGSCLFNDNRCFLRTGEGAPVVQVHAPHVVAGDNYLEGTSDNRALVIDDVSRFTVLGNITSGQIEVAGSALGAPWSQLNVLT